MKELENKKIVFVSNFFNHHQQPFSNAMFSKFGNNYLFIETSTISEERKKMGWEIKNKPKYVIGMSNSNYDAIQHIINTAGVVIIGSSPIKLIKKRIYNNKITFRYLERPLKDDSILKFFPRFLKWHLQKLNKKNIYTLCASAYTAYDFFKFNMYKNRCYKWGYFPKTIEYDIDTLISSKKDNNLLFVSRFISCKHPELIIQLAKKLKDEGYNYNINMIGRGELEESIKQQICINKLEDNVHLIGTMKPEQVRKYMDESDIFLFTSDRNEGWGAVINEAMNSGCAVVASHAIGSVPFLIKNKENGLIYKDGDFNGFYQKVKFLLDNKLEKNAIGKNAYLTIRNQWNAEVAVDRLSNLINSLLEGKRKPNLYDDGVCSKAEIIRDDWYNE